MEAPRACKRDTGGAGGAEWEMVGLTLYVPRGHCTFNPIFQEWKQNQGKLGGKQGGSHDRNGGGEGNHLLLVEATQELRPKEGEGDRHGESWGSGVLEREQSRRKGPEV